MGRTLSVVIKQRRILIGMHLKRRSAASRDFKASPSPLSPTWSATLFQTALNGRNRIRTLNGLRPIPQDTATCKQSAIISNVIMNGISGFCCMLFMAEQQASSPTNAESRRRKRKNDNSCPMVWTVDISTVAITAWSHHCTETMPLLGHLEIYRWFLEGHW